MRELERETLPSPLDPLVLVGRGRVGGSLARAAEAAGLEARLASHDDASEQLTGAGALLLCVPDTAISDVCRELAADAPRLVGHVSGAATLDVLAAATEAGRETFSLHPLQTFPD